MRHLLPIVLSAAALAGCAESRALAPSVKGVAAHLAGIDFDGVDLSFDVDVDNPLPVTIPAPQLSYQFDVEGSKLASADGAKIGPITASKMVKHTVPMRIGFKELSNVVKGLEGKNEAAYKFAGSFALPALGTTYDLPFSKEGTFPVVRPPSISVRSVDTSGISYSGGTLAVDADISNPNSFVLGLEDLGWSLDFGGTQVGGLRAGTGGTVPAGETKSLRLEAALSAADAVKALMKGRGALPKLVPTGSLVTPWGPIRMK